ncbi:hypothetical protein [Nocardioides hwasunensis]|uniref:DUF559 domain-containing protein n=1 Tax=Nocardioides hwasunensis TaxID=397258 RepID=A0ABR8MCX0_9ACTN|nr:hypothetical protein [Nocardioides hwasunensis]MBD3913802.1 hypothetical protein [Nocardioides hwasunensis]
MESLPRALRDDVRPGLVRPVRRDPTGRAGPTDRQVRSGKYRRTSQGLYVPADVELTREQRIVEAAAVLPSYGGVTGWAALAWAGGSWFSGVEADGTKAPVPLAIGPRKIRQQASMLVTADTLPPDHVVELDGLPMTSIMWSLAWELRHAPNARRAVGIADMAAYSDLVSRSELQAWAADMLPQTGVDNVRAAAEMMDENSWSWQETALRLVWMLDVGLDRPLSNRAIFDLHGRHLATCDLLDVEAALVIEYNGKLHDVAVRRRIDEAREELLRNHGITMLTVVDRHMQDRAALAEILEDARAEALRSAPAQRTWTIEAPPGWTPTGTVAQRRALTDVQRARLLGHRTGAAA